MATVIQRRRGTTAQHATFAGAVGEITVDTTKKVAVVHDGATLGGVPMAKESDVAGKANSTDVAAALDLKADATELDAAVSALQAEIDLKVNTSAVQTTVTDDDAKVPTGGAVVDYVAANACVVQYKYAEYTANTDLTTVIPYDDTIPQVTEGTQVLSVTITPKSASSKIIIRGALTGAVGTAAQALCMAVFVNGGANAIFASSTIMGGANYTACIPFEFEHAPGSTSAQTYTVRVGPSSGTARLNGTSSVRRFGGISKCTLIAEERVA